jgi:hypothetical protein
MIAELYALRILQDTSPTPRCRHHSFLISRGYLVIILSFSIIVLHAASVCSTVPFQLFICFYLCCWVECGIIDTIVSSVDDHLYLRINNMPGTCGIQHNVRQNNNHLSEVLINILSFLLLLLLILLYN